MSTPDFKRARSSAAKRARELAVLEVAQTLAEETGIHSVTLTDIAARVGMHKSAMLRYFETKEQIFLILASQAWHEWVTAMRNDLDDCDAILSASELAGMLSDSLIVRPFFCDVIAHTALALERNVSLESVRVYKRGVLADVGALATALRERFRLTESEASDVITTATSMAGALWQMAAPGTELRELYEQEPDLAHALVDVGPQLRRILDSLLSGFSNLT